MRAIEQEERTQWVGVRYMGAISGSPLADVESVTAILNAELPIFRMGPLTWETEPGTSQAPR